MVSVTGVVHELNGNDPHCEGSGGVGLRRIGAGHGERTLYVGEVGEAAVPLDELLARNRRSQFRVLYGSKSGYWVGGGIVLCILGEG